MVVRMQVPAFIAREHEFRFLAVGDTSNNPCKFATLNSECSLHINASRSCR